MDEKEQNEIPEYIKTLPKAVQDIVFDSTWEERTTEIAKKYSLNQNQTDALINTVLFVLTGLEKPETFLQTIIIELGISQLMAVQIIEDLEIRVFKYALNKLENMEKPSTATSPEIHQKNLPAVELGETAHNISHFTVPQQNISTPKYTPVYKPSPVPQNNPANTTPQNPISGQSTPSHINYTPRNSPPLAPENSPYVGHRENAVTNTTPEIKPKEPIQQPIPITRFSINQAPENLPTDNNPQNIVENKLNTMVKSINGEPTQEKPPQKYNTDPYREPLE